MRTPLQAMIWELWRTSRFELLSRIGWLLAGVALLCMFSVAKNVSEPEIQVLNGIFVMILTIVSVATQTWIRELDRQSIGFTFRLGFARPVSTTQLVAVPMIFTIAASVTSFLLPASVYNLLAGMSMPLVGPATVIVCVVPCFMAVTWSPTTIFGKVLGFSGLAIGMVVSLVLFHTQGNNPHPLLMAIGNPEYYAFGWQHYLAFVFVMALAFGVTVVAVERQRHGDRWQIEGLSRWWRRTRNSTRPPQRPFTSRFTAQCWYEMRRFGRTVLLLGVFGPALVLAFVTIVPWIDSRFEGSPFAWLGALIICPLVYQIVGAEGALGLRCKQGATQLSAFDATRAMPNDRLIASKLLVIAACSLIGWLCMGLAAGLHAALAGDWQQWVRIGETVSRAVGDVPVYWWFAGASNAALLYISSSSILLAFGLWLPSHSRLFLGLAIASYIHIILAVWDAHHDWTLRYLWVAYGYLMPVAIVAGCVLALRKALLAGYLGKRLFGWAFCLWVVYVTSTVALYLKAAPAISVPPAAIWLGGSLLLVPLATTAIAPLALASHRHA